MIEQPEWLASIKRNKKALEAQEKEALATLDEMLADGSMDDARDCGEDRWLCAGMVLTRGQRMGGWIHSAEAKLKIDAIQSADIENGKAQRKPPTSYWTARLSD